MIVTKEEQVELLQCYTTIEETDIRETTAFIEGMLAAFELVDKKLKEKKGEQEKNV
jgi:hypothetical protein